MRSATAESVKTLLESFGYSVDVLFAGSLFAIRTHPASPMMLFVTTEEMVSYVNSKGSGAASYEFDRLPGELLQPSERTLQDVLYRLQSGSGHVYEESEGRGTHYTDDPSKGYWITRRPDCLALAYRRPARSDKIG